MLSSAKQGGERLKRLPKAPRGTPRPKRALSAYMFFSQDWRERIKNEIPMRDSVSDSMILAATSA